MGYRDDLIRRLQEDGVWDQLPGEQCERLQGLTDEQARQMMVMGDQWDMGEERAVHLLGLLALVKVITLFNGTLVERRGEQAGKLSKAGRLLAEFFVEIWDKGLSADDVEAGLQELSPLVVAALATLYKCSE